jgi:hypothetical protein
MQPEENGVRTWQWVVTVIVIIILILLGYYMLKGNGTTAPTSEVETGTDSSLVVGKDTNRVVINDQFPGNIVYLSSVQLAKPGFVVIHKDNKGVPGDIIGYQYFEKGINPGKITLTTPTAEGQTYYAMLHSDNGDKKFDAKLDLPLKDAAGNAIMKMFRSTSTVVESKG